MSCNLAYVDDSAFWAAKHEYVVIQFRDSTTTFEELLRDFDQKIIECSICLSTKLGKLCHVISICGHAFCRECLNQFFSTLINDGDVEIKCPECGEIIPPHDVKLYVEPEVFERFDRLLLERGLDGMDDIFYCPQKDCRSGIVK